VHVKRTLVQLDEETYRHLRQLAFRQARSVSSLVREMVANGLEGGSTRKKLTDVDQLSSVRAGRSKQGRRLSPVSEKHDEALASAFKT
jgi:predicted DNA-binding protein